MARTQPSRRSPRKPAPPKGARLPNMVFSTDGGELLEHPYLKMAVHNGLEYALPEAINLNPIPERWDVMRLPDTFPVGYDPTTGAFEVVESIPGSTHKPRATAIHPPPGFVNNQPLAPCTLKAATSKIGKSPNATQFA